MKTEETAELKASWEESPFEKSDTGKIVFRGEGRKGPDQILRDLYALPTMNLILKIMGRL